MSTCSTITATSLAGLIKSQFLDRNDQFAKDIVLVAKVRLFFDDGRQVDLTKAEYSSLPKQLKDTIKLQDSL